MVKIETTTCAITFKEEVDRVTEFLEDFEAQKPHLAEIQQRTTKEYTQGFLNSNPSYETVQLAVAVVEKFEEEIMLHLHQIHKMRTLGKRIIDEGHFADFAIRDKLNTMNYKWAKLVCNVVSCKKAISGRLDQLQLAISPEQQEPKHMMVAEENSNQVGEKMIIKQDKGIKRIRIDERIPNDDRIRVYGVFDDYNKWGAMRINDSQLMKKRAERFMGNNVASQID